MATTFVIENTAGTLKFLVNPGALNGPGSVDQDSDMRLYGLGTLLWGEGANTNMLRLTENFACPDKGELGSPSTNTGVPQDEGDLGGGRGINQPITGQLWYSTTDGSLYVYDDTFPGWKPSTTVVAGDSPPTNASVGSLWYDTSLSSPGCSNPILKVYNPGHPEAVDFPSGWLPIGTDYVSQCGDYMSGELSMAELGSPLVRNRITNLGDPLDLYDAATKDYVDTTSGALGSHIADFTLHLTTFQNDALDGMESCITVSATVLAADLCALGGYSIATGTVYTDLIGRVDTTGDTMTGTLVIDGGSGFPDTSGLTIRANAGPAIKLETNAAAGNSPTISWYNHDNDPAFTAPAAHYPYCKIANRDDTFFTIEADKDDLGSGSGVNTKTIVEAKQADGVMNYNGHPDLDVENTIRTPNATIADVGANVKNLTTKEYVDSVITGAFDLTQVFAAQSAFTTQNGTTNTGTNVGFTAGPTGNVALFCSVDCSWSLSSYGATIWLQVDGSDRAQTVTAAHNEGNIAWSNEVNWSGVVTPDVVHTARITVTNSVLNNSNPAYWFSTKPTWVILTW